MTAYSAAITLGVYLLKSIGEKNIFDNFLKTINYFLIIQSQIDVQRLYAWVHGILCDIIEFKPRYSYKS